jgi:hypothetical protein
MLTSVFDQAVPMPSLLLARAIDIISVGGMAFTSVQPTSIVGAILWTGHLGNALVTHLPII